jgi:hypothetical protein
MTIRLFFNFTFLYYPSSAYAQKEAAIWYFGYGAGLDFNSEVLSLTNGSLNTSEGCASISETEIYFLYRWLNSIQ